MKRFFFKEAIVAIKTCYGVLFIYTKKIYLYFKTCLIYRHLYLFVLYKLLLHMASQCTEIGPSIRTVGDNLSESDVGWLHKSPLGM